MAFSLLSPERFVTLLMCTSDRVTSVLSRSPCLPVTNRIKKHFVGWQCVSSILNSL